MPVISSSSSIQGPRSSPRPRGLERRGCAFQLWIALVQIYRRTSRPPELHLHLDHLPNIRSVHVEWIFVEHRILSGPEHAVPVVQNFILLWFWDRCQLLVRQPLDLFSQMPSSTFRNDQLSEVTLERLWMYRVVHCMFVFFGHKRLPVLFANHFDSDLSVIYH